MTSNKTEIGPTETAQNYFSLCKNYTYFKIKMELNLRRGKEAAHKLECEAFAEIVATNFHILNKLTRCS